MLAWQLLLGFGRYELDEPTHSFRRHSRQQAR
jgi:hypothetical protein